LQVREKRCRATDTQGRKISGRVNASKQELADSIGRKMMEGSTLRTSENAFVAIFDLRRRAPDLCFETASTSLHDIISLRSGLSRKGICRSQPAASRPACFHRPKTASSTEPPKPRPRSAFFASSSSVSGGTRFGLMGAKFCRAHLPCFCLPWAILCFRL